MTSIYVSSLIIIFITTISISIRHTYCTVFVSLSFLFMLSCMSVVIFMQACDVKICNCNWLLLIKHILLFVALPISGWGRGPLISYAAWSH